MTCGKKVGSEKKQKSEMMYNPSKNPIQSTFLTDGEQTIRSQYHVGNKDTRPHEATILRALTVRQKVQLFLHHSPTHIYNELVCQQYIPHALTKTTAHFPVLHHIKCHKITRQHVIREAHSIYIHLLHNDCSIPFLFTRGSILFSFPSSPHLMTGLEACLSSLLLQEFLLHHRLTNPSRVITPCPSSLHVNLPLFLLHLSLPTAIVSLCFPTQTYIQEEQSIFLPDLNL